MVRTPGKADSRQIISKAWYPVKNRLKRSSNDKLINMIFLSVIG